MQQQRQTGSTEWAAGLWLWLLVVQCNGFKARQLLSSTVVTTWALRSSTMR
jgi:hypothetical protein